MIGARAKGKQSELMSKVHSKDAKPELLVRRLVYGMGFLPIALR